MATITVDNEEIEIGTFDPNGDEVENRIWNEKCKQKFRLATFQYYLMLVIVYTALLPFTIVYLLAKELAKDTDVIEEKLEDEKIEILCKYGDVKEIQYKEPKPEPLKAIEIQSIKDASNKYRIHEAIAIEKDYVGSDLTFIHKKQIRNRQTKHYSIVKVKQQ